MACLHAELTHEEREEIREAAEHVFEKADQPRSMDEWVELVLAEADASARRREMAVVQICPHCGGRI